MRRLASLVVLLGLWSTPFSALAAGAAVHRVAKGQTLGKIAKRYNVSIEALSEANGIDRRGLIKPGQRLVIPPKDDPDGKRTRAQAARQARPGDGSPPTRASKPLRWHTVFKGQVLGSIARRYQVSLDALCRANDVPRCRVIRPGLRLVIPASDDSDGSLARAARLAAEATGSRAEPPSGAARNGGARAKGAARHGSSWSRYEKSPRRKGYITVVGRKDRRYAGWAVTQSGRVLPKAQRELARVLATSAGDQMRIDPRLIQLLVRASDTFGGRTLRVVSGYRTGDTRGRSRHRRGQALDFTIDGVPNTALRDYLKTFDKVGVGYYPNSHFVHLDVRERWTYWVDYSGPGQRPRYGGFGTR